LTAGLRREGEGAPALVRRGKIRLGPAVGPEDAARDVRGLPALVGRLEIDPARQAPDQVAALGVELDHHAVEEDGDRLRDGFDDPAVPDHEREAAFALRDVRRQVELRRAFPGGAELRLDPEHFRPVHARLDRHDGAGRRSALGLEGLERGHHLLPGAVSLLCEDDLRAEPGRPVGPDVEGPARRRDPQLRERRLERVLAPGGSVRDLPRECRDPSLRPRHLAERLLAAGRDHLEDGRGLRLQGHEGVGVHYHHPAPHGLARAIHGLVGRDERERPVRAAEHRGIALAREPLLGQEGDGGEEQGEEKTRDGPCADRRRDALHNGSPA
jgi:hypothetical protein